MFNRIIWRLMRFTKLSRIVEILEARRKIRSTYPDSDHAEYTIEKNGFSDWSWYRTNVDRYKELSKVAESLDYSTRQRLFQSVSSLCAVDTLELPISPKILLVGYREDTYDAQGLVKLGFSPEVEYLDINPAPTEQILRKDSFDSFKILKRDAKRLREFGETDCYDLIYFSRACLDEFPWQDAVQTLESAIQLANTAVIAHIQSIFWNRMAELPESIPPDDWLVLDLLRNDSYKSPFETKLWDHLSKFAVRSGSDQIRNAMAKSSDKRQIIKSISMNRSDDMNRVLTLSEFPGSPELFSTQLASSPLSEKMSYYMSSILMWRTAQPAG